MQPAKLRLAVLFVAYGLCASVTLISDPEDITLHQYSYDSLFGTNSTQRVGALLANFGNGDQGDYLQGTRVCALSDDRVLVFARHKENKDPTVRAGYIELLKGPGDEWSSMGFVLIEDEDAWWQADWDEVSALHCEPQLRTVYIALSINCFNPYSHAYSSGLNMIDMSGLCFNTAEYVAVYKLTLPVVPGSGEHTMVGGVIGATNELSDSSTGQDWQTTAAYLGPGPRADTLYVVGSTRRNLVEPYLYGPDNVPSDQWRSRELYTAVISTSTMSMVEYYRVPTPNDTIAVLDEHLYVYSGASLGADGLWACGRRKVSKGATTQFFTSYVARIDAHGNLMYYDDLGMMYDDMSVTIIAATIMRSSNTTEDVVVIASLNNVLGKTFDARIAIYEASDATGGALGAEISRISFSTPKVDYFMRLHLDHESGVLYAPFGAGSTPLLSSFSLPSLAPLAEYAFPCSGVECLLTGVDGYNSNVYATGYSGHNFVAAKMNSPVNLAFVQVPKARSASRMDRLYTQYSDGMLSFSAPTDQATINMATYPCSHNGSVLYGYTRSPLEGNSPSTVVIDQFPEFPGSVPIYISSQESLFVKSLEAHGGCVFVGMNRPASYPVVQVYDLAGSNLLATYNCYWRATGSIVKLIYHEGALYVILNFTFDKQQGSSFELLKLEWKDTVLTYVAGHVLSTDYHTGTMAHDAAVNADGVLFVCGESKVTGVRPPPIISSDSMTGDLEAFAFSFNTTSMLPDSMAVFASPSYDSCLSIDVNRAGTSIFLGGITRGSLDGSGGLSSREGWVKAVSWPGLKILWTQQTRDGEISTPNNDAVTAVTYDEGARAVLVGGYRAYDEDYLAMFSEDSGAFQWRRSIRSELDTKCQSVVVNEILVIGDEYYSVGSSCVSLHPSSRSAPYSGIHIDSAKLTRTTRPAAGRRLQWELQYPLEDIPCPGGYYQPLPGRSSCQPCEKTGWAGEGQSLCYTCNTPGTRPSYDQTGCIPCEAGHYSRKGGVAECISVPAGHYQDSTGSTGAIACPAGHYTDTSGQRSCKPCEPGTYTSRTGTIQCAVCPAGQYQGEYGSRTCTECAVNTYSDRVGSRECSVCPNGSTTESEGAQSKRECQCPEGQYGSPFRGVPCSACPPKTRCPRNSEYPKPYSGVFVRSSSLGSSYVCSPVHACPGGEDLDSCDDGYSGEACSECSSGYYRTQGECVKCLVDPLPAWMQVMLQLSLYFGGIILIVATMCFYGVYVALVEALERLVTLCVAGFDVKMVLGMVYRFAVPVLKAILRAAKGFIRYMQLSTLVLGVSVPWPSGFKVLSSVFSVANIDVGFAFQIPCLENPDEYTYADQYVSRVTMYLVTAAILLAGIIAIEMLAVLGRVYVIPVRKARMAIGDIMKEHSKGGLTHIETDPGQDVAEHMTRSEQRVASLIRIRNRVRANAIMFADVLYLVFHATATEPFQCYEKTSGVFHMTMDPTVQCYSKGVWSDTLLPLGIITFVIFSVGIPLAVTTIVTSTWLTKSRHVADIESSFAYLWDPYRDGMKGWQVVSIMYRALIGCAVFISFSGEGDQFLILFVLFCGYTLITVRNYPFEDLWENRAESAVGVVLVSTSVIGMILLNTEGVSSEAATLSSIVCLGMHVLTWTLIIILSVRQCEFPTSHVKTATSHLRKRASSSSLLRRGTNNFSEASIEVKESDTQSVEGDRSPLENALSLETGFNLLSSAKEARVEMADFEAVDSHRPGDLPDTHIMS